jgi:hypothetical protein
MIGRSATSVADTRIAPSKVYRAATASSRSCLKRYMHSPATSVIVGAMLRARKNPHAVALGRLGGLKGGPLGGRARAAALSPRRRADIARRAAASRWGARAEHVPDLDEVRGWLADAGAPLSHPDSPSTARKPGSIEELVLHAARVAEFDAHLTRALPVFLWRKRSRLDFPKLVRLTKAKGLSRVVGFFLDLTADLSDDAAFRTSAGELRPRRASRNTFFFRSSGASRFAREAARRNTPLVAKRWGWLMNMPFDSFQTMFDKFRRHDEAARAS